MPSCFKLQITEQEKKVIELPKKKDTKEVIKGLSNNYVNKVLSNLKIFLSWCKQERIIDEVKKYFQQKVYRTVIPRNVRLSEAPSHGHAILTYDAKSKGAEVYLELAKEVISCEQTTR